MLLVGELGVVGEMQRLVGEVQIVCVVEECPFHLLNLDDCLEYQLDVSCVVSIVVDIQPQIVNEKGQKFNPWDLGGGK